jgi:hypothetical protein
MRKGQKNYIYESIHKKEVPGNIKRGSFEQAKPGSEE